MWIFTDDGFYSIIQKPGENELTICAQVKADLERLKEHYLPQLSGIVETPDSDYRFQATTTHAAFSQALYRIGHKVNYSSFNNIVAKKRGIDRAKIHANIWADTFSLRDLKDEHKHTKGNSQKYLSLGQQRLMMRALFQSNADKDWRAMPFFAVAEKIGLVTRKSNQGDISPEEYSKRLFKDGLAKGWIGDSLTDEEWGEVFRAFVYRFLLDEATFNAWVKGTAQ